MTERAIAIRPEQGLALPSWQEMREQATVLVKSGFLPKHIDSPEKALTIMLTGRELGVPPMAAMRGLYVVDGKAVANAQLMLALAHRTGELEQFRVADADDGCTVTVKRRGYDALTTTWTDEDTKRAGLGGFAWQKYPRVMRRWRAVTEALRLAMPDVLAGVYQPEELGVGYKVEGDDIVIDVQPGRPDPRRSTAEEPREGEMPYDSLDMEKEASSLRLIIAETVRQMGKPLDSFNRWFLTKYGCKLSDAGIDALVDCSEQLKDMSAKAAKKAQAEDSITI